MLELSGQTLHLHELSECSNPHPNVHVPPSQPDQACIPGLRRVNRTFLAILLVAVCLGSQLAAGTLFWGLRVLTFTLEDICPASRRMRNN